MDYVTAEQARALVALKRRDAALVGRVTRTDHARSVARRGAIHFWIGLGLSLLVVAGAWLYLQLRALRTQYTKEYEWWAERYTRGPRPAGQYHYRLTCVCLAAEYPPFAALACGALPQSSAIFILTMLQHFGDHMEGIHYSGSRTQLRGASFRTFVRDFASWNVPDNHWRFLFPTKARFDLSSAVQTAKSMPSGGSALQTLYDGGLCQMAVDFYKEDRSAAQMCHMLLDAELVYYQACGAAKLSAALRNGVSVGSAAGGIAGMVFGKAIQTASTRFALRTALTSGLDASIDGAAEGAAEGVIAAACAPFIALFGIGYAACVGSATAAMTLTMAITTVTTVAVTAASTAAFYATMPCPTGQYYTLVQQRDGSYRRVEWDGDAKDLPRRAS